MVLGHGGFEEVGGWEGTYCRLVGWLVSARQLAGIVLALTFRKLAELLPIDASTIGRGFFLGGVGGAK